MLYLAEVQRQREEAMHLKRTRRKQVYSRVEELTFWQAFCIGLSQIFALIPGISRSGITMVAGMRARLSHQDALRFAFLLLVPAIAAASLLEIPKLLAYGHTVVLETFAGGAVAAIVAYLSIRFLTRYFQVGRLTPFAFYCLGGGLVTCVLFVLLTLGAIHLPWAS